MSDNKDMIPYKGIKGVLIRIHNWFKSLFGKKEGILEKRTEEEKIEKSQNEKASSSIEENRKENNEEVQNGKALDDSEKVTEGTYKPLNKEEFFKVYQDVKDGKVKLDDLPFYEVMRINKIATDELDRKVNQYEQIEKEIVEAEIEEHSSKKYTNNN